jgi:hypothetical protein
MIRPLREIDGRGPPPLREAFHLSGFSVLCNEVLDEFVRQGKRVPNALKKPN